MAKVRSTSSRAERFGAIMVVLTACAGTSVIAQDAKFPSEQVKRGAALYAANCESCHGVRMVGPPWAIDLKTFPKDGSARFIDSVTYGVRNMPPWGDVLKRDDIEALWAYVAVGEP